MTIPAAGSGMVTGDFIVWRVAVPSPLRKSFDYLPPQEPAPEPAPGMRLKVPFGRGTRTGVLLEVAEGSALPRNKLKRVSAVLDSGPIIDPELIRFLRWAADYYHHPLSEVIFHALPQTARQGRSLPERGISVWSLTSSEEEALTAGLERAPRQQEMVRILARYPQGLNESLLAELNPRWRAPMRALKERGLVKRCVQPPQIEAESGAEPGQAVTLNPNQLEAVNRVYAAGDQFGAFLLNGVTGSGKTEVYLELISRLLPAGRQALLLIPEIGLTPQIVSRFRARLGVPVAVLHSGLSDRERFAAWLDARDGRAPVVIGTRSAVFTPLARPGLFIVDEEQDPSFKQQEGLRYSARDLAVVRGQMCARPVVLGSATPSLETLHNVACGRYARLNLPQRAGEATPPLLEVVDLRGRALEAGVSEPIFHALRACGESGGQAILFINRRGFAPGYLCRGCGWVASCERCDANMVLHRPREQLLCHHCGARRSPPEACPACGAEEFKHRGVGTQRVAEALSARIPGARIFRVDRDSTRRKGAFEHLIESMHRGETDIVVGTQMVAKGHHFPDVTLVGVLDADSGLFGVDFRAGERMAQLLLQVAGRAGRGEKPGRVMIQTHHPDHPLLRALIENGYESFAQSALAERAAAGLPPLAHMALLRAEASQSDTCERFLGAALRCGQAHHPGVVSLLGPVPAPMARRAGRYRWQLFAEAAERAPLHRFLKAWVRELENLPAARRVRWSLDVDPQEII